MVKSYIPGRGDIVWLDFELQAGHEQSGRRSALVISPQIYNEKVHLALMCPITSRIKGYPFEQLLDVGKVKGVILTDQLRSLDWHARNASFIARAQETIVKKVQERIIKLVAGV